MEVHLQTTTNMYCQKCRTQLKLDGSLDSLNPAAFDLLTSIVSLDLHSLESLYKRN